MLSRAIIWKLRFKPPRDHVRLGCNRDYSNFRLITSSYSCFKILLLFLYDLHYNLRQILTSPKPISVPGPALGPEHADELAELCSGDPLLAPLQIAYSFHIVYGGERH